MFKFTSIDDVERTILEFRDRGQSGYLVFQDIPYDTFLQLNTHYCASLYIRDAEILRLKMSPGRAHNAAAGEFAKILTMKYVEMRVVHQVSADSTGLMELRNVSKEADGSWGPADEDYVTCVLEVGKSESQRHLVLDSRIWLESEGSHVSQVITMKITEDKPLITIQKWEATSRRLRTTRADRPRQALKTEEVQVSLVNNVPTASGSLRLSFAKLFERPPRPNTKEEDIVFTPDELVIIARRVWRRQNLIGREMAR